MRKALSCVLMMTLLLTGCGSREEEAVQRAVLMRGQYLSMSAWSAVVDLRVDYGEKVYEFTVDASWQREGETVLTVVEPELLAGITARITPEDAVLEYDGAGLSLGVLDGAGMTPIAAIPALMNAAAKGYMAWCGWREEGEQTLLEMVCRDPEQEPGEGTEYSLIFDPDSCALLQGEVSVDGAVVLTAAVRDFTMEMSEDDAGEDADVG